MTGGFVIVGAHLLRPDKRPPMTREQSLRGADETIPWLVIASAFDAQSLERGVSEFLSPESLERMGAMPGIVTGSYRLHHTATAQEASRTSSSTM